MNLIIDLVYQYVIRWHKIFGVDVIIGTCTLTVYCHLKACSHETLYNAQ